MAKETIVLDFQINVKEALDNITNAKEALVSLREEQKALQKEILKGTATEDMKKRFGELTVEIRELTGVINTNNRELQNQIKAQEAAEGSLASYRAQIKNLKNAYAELSEEERNSAKGKELVDKMDKLTNSAKAAEWQLQGVPKGLSKTVAAMSQVNFGAGRAAAGIAQLGKAFKALMANPIVLAIGAVVAVIKKLIDSFQKSDSAMTTLKRSMSGFQAILSVIEKGFQKVVDVIAKVIGKIGEFANKLVSMIPGMDKYVQAQEDIVTSTDELEETERKYAVESAERQAKISELRNKSTESEKYSYKQRKQFLEEALQLEKKEAQEKKDIAVERLRIAEQEALQEIGYTEMTEEAWATLSDQQKDTLTELRVQVTQTTTELNNSTRKMTSQVNNFQKQARSEQQERIKKENEELRKLQDLTVETFYAIQQKEIEVTRLSYTRQIEDIKYRLKTEEGLTKKAKEAMNKQIVVLESDLQIQLGEIDRKYTYQRIDQMKSLYLKFYQELSKQKPDDVELQVRISDATFAGEIEGLQRRNEEIERHLQRIKEGIEQATEEERIALENEKNINDSLIGLLTKNSERAADLIRYNAKTAKEAVMQANEEIQKEIQDNKMLGIYADNEVEKSKIFEEQSRRRLAAAEREQQRLASLTEEEVSLLYNSQEEYDNALLEAENKVVLAQNDVAQAVKNTTKAIIDQQGAVIDSFNTIANATGQLLGSFEELFNNMAESDEKYAKYAKAMALMQILISTAVSIASAIQGATEAGAATGPGAVVATPAFIIELVAIVTGAIASAVGVLKKAEKPSKPKFAEGGLVGGTTSTRTDDSVDAQLSVGEFVMRSASVKSIGVQNLNAMNQTGMLPASATNPQNTNQLSMEAFKDIMVEAISEIQPQVSVKEITSMQNKVSVKESIAKY